MKSPIARISGVIAVSILAAGAHTASAQPGHGPGPGGPGGAGIEQVIASLKAQLNLNTSQQAMWDSITANGKTARASARASMEQVHAALNAELAKAEPDFATVAALSDQAQANAQAGRKQVRDQWLALYATFTPAQKAVVRDAFKTRLARIESFRARMKERFDGGAPAN